MRSKYRFIDSKRGVHVEFFSAPFRTLCGWSFDEEGRSLPLDQAGHGKLLEPFLPTDKAVVTCPVCADIIEICRSLAVTPEEHPRVVATSTPEIKA